MTVRVWTDGKLLRKMREMFDLSVEQAAALMSIEPHFLAGLEGGTRTMTVRQAADFDARAKKLFTDLAVKRAAETRIAEGDAREAKLPGAARPPLANPTEPETTVTFDKEAQTITYSKEEK